MRDCWSQKGNNFNIIKTSDNSNSIEEHSDSQGLHLIRAHFSNRAQLGFGYFLSDWHGRLITGRMFPPCGEDRGVENEVKGRPEITEMR